MYNNSIAGKGECDNDYYKNKKVKAYQLESRILKPLKMTAGVINNYTHPEEVEEVKKISNKMLKLMYKGIALELFEDADEKEVTLEEFCLATAKYVDCAVQIEKNPIERSLFELVCLTNSKKVFDEIFGEEGNGWLKKECE